jgi:hypothetical protein
MYPMNIKNIIINIIKNTTLSFYIQLARPQQPPRKKENTHKHLQIIHTQQNKTFHLNYYGSLLNIYFFFCLKNYFLLFYRKKCFFSILKAIKQIEFSIYLSGYQPFSWDTRALLRPPINILLQEKNKQKL